MMGMLAVLAHLPEDFRANAEKARQLACAEGAAHVWEAAAGELDKKIRAAELEALDLELATQESGYTRGHLVRMLRERVIPNAGTDSAPQILRKHLPRKPGFGVDQQLELPPSSRVQAARAVIEGDN